MAEDRAPVLALDAGGVTAQVLDILRGLAGEAGGERAARAVRPGASLERDLGLGSLERVELLLRLEAAFARRLPDACLQLDTPEALARALLDADGIAEEHHQRPEPAAGAAVPLGRAATLQEALARRAQAEPGRPHVYLREDDAPVRVVRYGELWDEAAAVAAGLRQLGVGAGDTVALMLPTGMDFLRTFQGVLAARAVNVPIYPPVRLDRLEEYARRQSAILRDAGVRVLVTIDRARPVAAILRSEVPTLRHVTTAAELAAAAGGGRAPEGRPEDAALIQYTSGSTGSPKGVLLTQANLMANVAAIGHGVQVRPDDVGASWLPLYHDMGLIGTWLFCMANGLPLDLQSPLAFLSRPERWLWAIHERRATLSPAPNFAFELCASRVPEQALKGLDLSSWRCALNGAEPVSPDTMERFARRFAPYGFRAEALQPVYGLAECSVALSFPPPGRGLRVARIARGPFEAQRRAVPARDGDAGALGFVSVGRALPEHEIHIVDDDAREVGPGTVGRLLFRGPSATGGYYRQPQATAAITLDGGWLDSGDLAFVLDGEVYIAGRLKDLIIKGGRNFVPQEIEELAAGVPGVRRGCVAAFGVAQEGSGTESLVVVAETRATDPDDRDRIARGVNERLADALGLPADVVAMVGPGAVPKTSSGKIRRARTRELYLSGELGRPERTPLATRARLVAAAAWAEVRPRAARALRGAYAVYLATVLALLFATLWPLAMVLPRRAATRVARFASRVLLRMGGIRVEVEGRERLAAAGRCIVASNHASYADVPVLLATLPPDVLFVAKREILGWPLVGPFLRKVGHLTVDRVDGQRGVADTARIARSLEAGSTVLFFPEGTFTRTAGLRPFRLGAFQAAADAGLPVVPLALAGTRRILRDLRQPRPGRAGVWIGEPRWPQGTGWRDVVALRDVVAEDIAARCGEPRLDVVTAAPAPFRP
jgi:1-acyl-sn-glycerol-3-phosphate acyltransferase